MLTFVRGTSFSGTGSKLEKFPKKRNVCCMCPHTSFCPPCKSFSFSFQLSDLLLILSLQPLIIAIFNPLQPSSHSPAFQQLGSICSSFSVREGEASQEGNECHTRWVAFRPSFHLLHLWGTC